MLTDAQKTDARRYMGYPMFGDIPSQMFGYRFMTQYGTLEYRMLHLSVAEEAVVVQHLTDCATLEAAIIGASNNLDTDKAAVWERNRDEVRDRRQLYQWKRRELCRFIGVNPGPGLSTGGEIIV